MRNKGNKKHRFDELTSNAIAVAVHCTSSPTPNVPDGDEGIPDKVVPVF